MIALPKIIEEYFRNNLVLVAGEPQSKEPWAPPWNGYKVLKIRSREDFQDAINRKPDMNVMLHGKESGLVQVDPDSKEARIWAVRRGLHDKGAWVIRSVRGLKALYRVPGVALPPTHTDKTHQTADIINELCMVPPSIHPDGIQLSWADGHSPADIPYKQLATLPQGLLDAWVELKGFDIPKVHNTNPPVGALNIIYEAILTRIEPTSRLTRHGDGMKGRCPLHDDKNPSFTIHPVNGWHCFTGCGKGRISNLAFRLGVTV